MFFFGNSKKRKLKKKLKKKQREAECRRTHIIIEARKKHEKNRKDAGKYLSKGGFATTASMEEMDKGFAVAQGVEKAIKIGGKAVSKVKSRQKHLQKSRNTHLAKLKSARAKMVARQRT